MVLQSELDKVLSYKNSENVNATANLDGKVKIEVKGRSMLHDNNAFKNRPNSSKALRSSSLKSSKILLKNSPNCKNGTEIKNKIYQITKEDPFLHKNFTEIPD